RCRRRSPRALRRGSERVPACRRRASTPPAKMRTVRAQHAFCGNCCGRATTVVDNLGRGAVSDDFILETENLTKEFAGFVAVNGVNLRVARGTIHALIGPNGAGKTTCFNLLTKFMSPTRGRISFKGRDITSLAPADVARLGVVRSFQISAVFPHLSVLENVRIALQRQRGGSFDFWRSKN